MLLEQLDALMALQAAATVPQETHTAPNNMDGRQATSIFLVLISLSISTLQLLLSLCISSRRSCRYPGENFSVSGPAICACLKSATASQLFAASRYTWTLSIAQCSLYPTLSLEGNTNNPWV